MSDVPNAVLDVYQRARAAYDAAPLVEKDAVLDPFVQELSSMDFEMVFGQAADLDEAHFGVWGNYWAHAFGNPKIGTQVNATYDSGDCIFEVIGRGLLTLTMDMIE